MSIAPLPSPRSILPALPMHAATVRRMPQTGDTLGGRYLLQQPIGSGGVAHVFRALHFHVRRPVAVKLLHQETLGEHSLAPRFEHEALALASLAHPNIVRLQDYGVTSGVQYLVMELAEGRTLREALTEDGAFEIERALSLTRQLLHALAYAHSQSIVHRDLKPLNLVVQALPDQPEHLKVLDFGFAKFLPGSELQHSAPVTSAGFAFGSPAYISPEQCAGDTIDGRADLYSVGVLLFEMLTGTPPFRGEVPELLRHHLYSPVPRLESVKPALAGQVGLQTLLDRALEKQRDARFGSAGEFLAALEALSAGVRSSPPSAASAAVAMAPYSASALAHAAAGRARVALLLTQARSTLLPMAEHARREAVRYALLAWGTTRVVSRKLWANAQVAWRTRLLPAAQSFAALAQAHTRTAWARAQPKLVEAYARCMEHAQRLRERLRKP